MCSLGLFLGGGGGGGGGGGAWGVGGMAGCSLMACFLTRTTILLDQGPPLMTSLNFNDGHKVFPNTVTLGLGLQPMNLGRGQGHNRDALEAFSPRRCGENTEQNI